MVKEGLASYRASDFRFSLFLLLLADFAVGVITGALVRDAVGKAGPSPAPAVCAAEASTWRNS
jgi:hypothetical protein